MNEETKDCARLPVVAWQDAESPLYTTAELRVMHEWAKNHYPIAELCRLTDAQARLAEKDARIAQLAAHARGKNKALANALKEIERLRGDGTTSDKYRAELYDEVWQRATGMGYGNVTEALAKLAQLQAAPAERGVVRQETNFVASTGEGRNPLYEGQFDDETPEQAAHRLHWSRTAMEVQSARLNPAPAPATADSDVREVKP